MSVIAKQWWDSGALISWATFFVGIAAIAVTVLLYLLGRRPEPRSEIVQWLNVVRLLVTDLGSQGVGNLKVMYRDSVLDDPYLVGLFVESRSLKDIASTRFDAKKPLVFNLGVPIAAVLGSPSGSAAAENCLTFENAGLVKIAPYLIREGPLLHVEVLTEGRPLLTVDSPLVEVDIHQLGVDDQRTVRTKKIARFSRPWIFALAVGILVLAIGIPIVVAVAVLLKSHR